MMKKNVAWLAAAAIIVVIFGTMYGAVQQSQRNAGDWPQVQLAEDMAAKLKSGVAPNVALTRDVEASDDVDVSTSLAPFISIFSKTGEWVGGSGYIESVSPENALQRIPFGVLRAADNKEYHRVTWEPESGVRIAAVAVAADKYYVVSGRNMREIEHDEIRTMQVAAFGCVVSLAILATAYIFKGSEQRKRAKKQL